MTTPHEPSSLNTPPFGQPTGPEYHPTQPIGAYRAEDFPAPAGVPPLSSGTSYAPAPGTYPGQSYGGGTATMVQPAPTTGPRRRTGVVVAAVALSAIIGAGAGIGSFSYLAGGTTGIIEPDEATLAYIVTMRGLDADEVRKGFVYSDPVPIRKRPGTEVYRAMFWVRGQGVAPRLIGGGSAVPVLTLE